MAEQLKENFQLLKNLFEECLVAKNNPNEPVRYLQKSSFSCHNLLLLFI